MMTPDNDKPKVTLEQLLRVKRAEQPAPEFWARFDRDLREKQLAAIVEPRPWWAPFIRVGSKLARYQVPIGATAVVALTLLTVRQYDSAAPAFNRPAVESRQLAEEAGRGAAIAAVATRAEPRGEMVEAASRAAVVSPQEEAPAARTLARSDIVEAAAQGSHSLGAEALLGRAASSRGEIRASDSIASRMVATNLRIVQNSEPELLPLGLHHVSGLRIASAQSSAPYLPEGELADEPFAQGGAEVAPPPRSSRLLARALPTSETAEVASSGGRSATLRLDRSISEERLYDSMRRGGLGGERVAIKF